jgi:hypothetical protein
MRVWYVRYEDDENLIDPNETIFFSTEEAALDHLEKRTWNPAPYRSHWCIDSIEVQE